MNEIVAEQYWRKKPKGTPKDLTGETSENLTVIGLSYRDTKLSRYIWRCRCKCGNEIDVSTGDWNAKRAKSCGCYRSRKGPSHPNYRHGINETRRKTGLRKNYGMTIEQYDKLIIAQNYQCAICGDKQEDKRLCVDHCHLTGRIRGLLCSRCNQGIGLLRDNADIMLSAIKYISRNGD
jgi:Recombination endonuclease VII